MFSNLIFLILILFVVNLAPSAEPTVFTEAPGWAFVAGLGLFACTGLLLLGLNYLYWRARHRTIPGLVASALLILTLAVFHFAFAAHRLYAESPLYVHIHVLFGLTSLTLYFASLWVYLSHSNYLKRVEYPRYEGWMQVRFLLPFALPYLVFEGLRDVLRALPFDVLHGTGNATADGMLSFLGTLGFLILLMILMPALIQRTWGCRPLPPGPMQDRMEALCSRAGFRHAGMKIWTIMEHTLSAAIIGVVPRFRYVMFTKGLLEELTPAEVEAVLAHEMGHSKHKHLVIFPFIIFGMMLTAGLVFLLLQDSLTYFFALEEALGNGAFWMAVQPFCIL
ncbi:MAG: M48 family metalloprotease, partial [Chlamydiia bacterium]|nr:M48 family metalloprotease [Chlamydiia bacterium]